MSNYLIFWKQYSSTITGLIRDILIWSTYNLWKLREEEMVGNGEKGDEIQIKEMGQHIFYIIMNIE